uniref:Putative wd-repeat protein n=1 Tax=Ixodes ricinus TaxID=34613 RepID=A0A131XRG4_IXORI
MAAPRYHVLVGAETGLLKGVNTEKRTFSNLNSVQEVGKESEITCLRWKDESESEVYAGLRSQVVKTYCPNSGVCKDTLDVKGGTGPIKGLGVVNSNLLTCVSSGLLKVWAKDEESRVEASVGSDVFRMRQHPQKQGLVATGGKENDLKLWDLENMQKPVFQAKNVRNDFLDLRVPVWVTDMQFLSDSDKVVAITGHHQVRVYDPGSRQRRPVVEFEFDEYPLTCISLTSKPEQVVVGNSRGRVALLDLRRKGMVHVFKGMAGSVRSVVCHPTLPLVASCGLDRFFRLHDLQTHMLLSKMYLKSRLNCLLLRTDFSVSEEAEKQEDAEAEPADDEIWQDMEEVEEAAEEPQAAQKRAKKKKPSAETRKRKKVCRSE